MLTRNRQLNAQSIIPVVAIIMGLLIVTRIIAFIGTGFAIETLIYAAIEAIMLVWSIMILKQNGIHSKTLRIEEEADQSPLKLP
jgi:hypothetical protein